jgi:hypothetical protein
MHPEPADPDSLDLLRSALNLGAPGSISWLRVLTWLLCALRPTGPYPILILRGPASGRTFAARVLRALIDNNASPFTSPSTTSPTSRRPSPILYAALLPAPESRSSSITTMLPPSISSAVPSSSPSPPTCASPSRSRTAPSATISPSSPRNPVSRNPLRLRHRTHPNPQESLPPHHLECVTPRHSPSSTRAPLIRSHRRYPRSNLRGMCHSNAVFSAAPRLRAKPSRLWPLPCPYPSREPESARFRVRPATT